MSDLDRLQDAFMKADALAQQGNEQAAQDARMFAQEIRRLQSAAPQEAGGGERSFLGEQGAMAQVNRGIAESVGGLVDFINPFDTPAVGAAIGMPGMTTGSARTGLARGMEAAGVNVADVEPEGIGQNIARGVGLGAGAAIPAGATARALQAAPGIIGGAAQSASQGLNTVRGLLAEAAAGGIGEGSGEAARMAGAGPVGQSVAEIAGGVLGGAGVAAAPRVTPSAIGARALGRAVQREIAPFTERGARGVAQQRLQELAGGPQRSEELGRMIRPETEIGLSPAQQTGDPNLLALEQSAMREDPLIREAMEAQRFGAESRARDLIAMGSRPEDAQAFLSQRQEEARANINSMVERATRRAAGGRPLAKITPSEASDVVATEIKKAEADALAQEKELWSQVPKGAQVSAEGSKAAAQSVLNATPWAQRSDIPSVVEQLTAQPDAQTVAEMHGLYSELRRIARSAMAGTDQNRNKARIANLVADNILQDLGAIDGSTEIGRTINQARAYSREMHEIFDRGTVGRLLKRTVDGDEQIDPLLSLERAMGRGGTQALVGSQDIRRAADTNAVDDAVEQYMINAFNDRVFSGDTFSQSKADTFLNQNREILGRFPYLRDTFQSAVEQQQRAKLAQTRGQDFEKGVSKSAASRFIEARPSEAIDTIFRASRPKEMAKSILQQARKDQSGKAIEGFKGAFSDYLMGQATARTPSGQVLQGQRLREVLDNPDVQKVMSQVYSPAEKTRLNAIAAELQKLDAARSGGAGVDALADRPTNALASVYGRILGARAGAQMGGGFAGGLQSAQIVSSRVQRILERVTNDKAQQMLRDAVQDPDLFRSLLMDVTIPKNSERISRSLAPYVAGGISTQADNADQPR